MPQAGKLVLAILATLGAGCATLSDPPREFSIDPGAVEVRHYFAGVPEHQVFRLSPDGKRLASLEPEGAAINVFVTDLDSGARTRVTDFDESRITGLAWANSERLLLHGPTSMDLLSINADGSFPRSLHRPRLQCAEHCSGNGERLYVLDYVQVIDPLRHDPEHVLVATNGGGKYSLTNEVQRMHVLTGRMQRIERVAAEGLVDRWFTDQDGNLIGAELEQRDQRVILLRDRASGNWKTWWRGPRDALRFTPAAVDAHSLQGYAVTNRAPDGTVRAHTGLYRFDFANHVLGEAVLETPGIDCCELFVAQWAGTLVSASYAEPGGHATITLAPGIETMLRNLGDSLGTGDVQITGTDSSMRRWVVRATAPGGRSSYYLHDAAAGKTVPLDIAPGTLEIVSNSRRALGFGAIVSEGLVADLPVSSVGRPNAPLLRDAAGRAELPGSN